MLVVMVKPIVDRVAVVFSVVGKRSMPPSAVGGGTLCLLAGLRAIGGCAVGSQASVVNLV